MQDKIPLIITFRNDNTNHRLRNLNYIIDYYNDICEVVIVEQDISPQVKELCCEKNVRYHFLYNDGYFNRGWGFNFGFKQCNLGENDIDRLKCIIADNTIIQQLDSIDYSNHCQLIIILSNLYQKLASSLLNSSEDFNNISNKINHTEFCKDSQRTIIRQMEVEDIETELTFEQI